MVRAIVSLAHGLGMQVVAQGVESRTQLMVLRSLGCDQAQGYFFSKPVPADEALAFLAE